MDIEDQVFINKAGLLPYYGSIFKKSYFAIHFVTTTNDKILAMIFDVTKHRYQRLTRYLHTSKDVHYSFFKRFIGNRGFHDLFNQHMYFCSKHYEHCKTGALVMCMNFSRILSDVLFWVFYEYEMSMGLYNGENP